MSPKEVLIPPPKVDKVSLNITGQMESHIICQNISDILLQKVLLQGFAD